MTLKELVPLVKSNLIPEFAVRMFLSNNFDCCQLKTFAAAAETESDDCFSLYQKVQSYISLEKKYFNLIWYRHFSLKCRYLRELYRLGNINIRDDTALKFCRYMLHTSAGLSPEKIAAVFTNFSKIELLPVFRVKELYTMDSEKECFVFLRRLVQEYPALMQPIETLRREAVWTFAAGRTVDKNLSFLCRLKNDQQSWFLRPLVNYEINERQSMPVTLQEFLCWMAFMRAYTV